MYHLLIVDDEISHLESLSQTYDWHALSIDNVHTAANAAEALTIIQNHVIDVVITDIKMPGMSGLDLISHINEASPHLQCIILSGYNDFEFAKEAIRQKAVRYLLKPVDEEELMAAVGTALGAIRLEREKANAFKSMQQTLQGHLPTLRSNLLAKWLTSPPKSPSLSPEDLALLGLKIESGDEILMMMIRLEEEFAHYDMTSLSLFEYAIANMAEEVFHPQLRLMGCKDSMGHLIFTVHSENEDIPVSSLLQWMDQCTIKLHRFVNMYLKGNISIILSGPGHFPSDLPSLHESALSKMQRKIGSNLGLLNIVEAELDSPLFAHNRLLEQPSLVHLLEAGQWKAVEDKLQASFADLQAKAQDSNPHLLEMFHHISFSISHYVHKRGFTLADMIEGDSVYIYGSRSFASLHQLQEWSMRVFAIIKRQSEENPVDDRLHLIRKVKQFIHLNLESATLQSAAEHIFVHPSYLSKIFKDETGNTFVEFLIRIKMERAEQLLRNPDLKVYEICHSLGYQSTPNFIKLFKSHFGLTPQEYRLRKLRV